ncbi:arylsulfatase [Synechococcus elongatus]|uniref:Arylsulfatase n=1 Tax=Synechococcus elongatus PCC 11801 TaxID=2219813 RepID=A0AAN1QPY3_SYNEL|nr:arylsulfatase [Synechococcus elongatus]AZB73285.1 arylsulfatase [Synechococcus elongatus PCC 11801]
MSIETSTNRPNIVLILTDNLGYGELGCYGGGELRGAPTPRADQLAAEGLRLTNFNVEAQCTPSRSALLTGRYAYRSGTLTVPIGNPAIGEPEAQGLNPWEITLASVLSDKGYKTAHYGKWHLGSVEGRFPTNHGFDEWWGIPRTTDEVFWPDSPGFANSGVEPQYILEGKKGEPTQRLAVYDLEQRSHLDAEITRRTIDFIERSVQAGSPFFAYVPLTQVHLPTLPHPDFAGSTGNGDFADSVVETDHRLGQILDTLDRLQISDNTIVIFTSDNGPDPTWPWQGSAGPWRGYYFTHMEGSLRVPFLIRWPGRIPAGRVSNEIVHQVDLFTTLSHLVGAELPSDRAIDGVDQTAFLLGQQSQSNRETVLAFVADRLEAVKWRNWKLAFYEETRDWFSTPSKLTLPKLFNLTTDPKEEYPEETLRNTWVIDRCLAAIRQFQDSLQHYPAIPEGTKGRFDPTTVSTP